MCTDLDEKAMKVSIVVPMYNAEKYIDRCVDSVLRQTNPNWELILVNDGSTDNTLSIANKYKKLDRRIRVLDGINQGVSCARNKGIEAVEGQITVFVDADDWIEDCYVEKICRYWEEGVDILVFNYNVAYSEDECIQGCSIQQEYKEPQAGNKFYLLSLLGYYNRLTNHQIYRLGVPWGKAYASDLLKDSDFPQGVSYSEDVVFNTRVFKRAKNIKYINQVLYNYFQNKESVMHRSHLNIDKMVESYKNVLIFIYGELRELIETDLEIKTAWNKFVLSRLKVCLSEQANMGSNSHETLIKDFVHSCARYLTKEQDCCGLSVTERVFVFVCYIHMDRIIVNILKWRKKK